MVYQCSECKKSYPIESHAWRCECGGLLDLAYVKKRIDFSGLGRQNISSLWRYEDALPLSAPEASTVSMGEGNTPLIALSTCLWGKMDFQMPTLSFKDRGAAVLVAMAKKLGVRHVAEDSSGNAGTAIAAYCARAGIQCEIFVPHDTSAKKVRQIEMHGAVLHKIPGTREDTAAATIKAVESRQLFYASHVFNPLFYEGTKTYVYEIFEHLGRLPDLFIIPVGNGTLLLGCHIAFREMLAWGYIRKMPRIIAVQAANCAPILQAFQKGATVVQPVRNTGTAAEGIAIAQPARGRQILQAITDSDGDVVGVTEQEIIDAQKDLALRGIYVEITSAANYAAYLRFIREHPEWNDREAVIPFCGAGLKSN